MDEFLLLSLKKRDDFLDVLPGAGAEAKVLVRNGRRRQAIAIWRTSIQ